jgi:RNA polymerase sigma-70 factor (ECF subfamily)
MKPTTAPEFIAATMENPVAELEDFDRVVAIYWPRIFRFVMASLRDRDAAETLTQDCFWKAYRSRAQFRGDCSLNTWLMKITVNSIRKFVRNQRLQFWRKIQGTASDTRSISDWFPDSTISAETRAVLNEQVKAVWDATQSLPDRQRHIFLLRFMEDMNTFEIAQATGLSEGTVKTHLFRAVHKVKTTLERSR